MEGGIWRGRGVWIRKSDDCERVGIVHCAWKVMRYFLKVTISCSGVRLVHKGRTTKSRESCQTAPSSNG